MSKESINFLRIDISIRLADPPKVGGFRPMHTTRSPETEKTSKHRGACQMHFARFQNNCFVERQILQTIILSQKNPDQ